MPRTMHLGSRAMERHGPSHIKRGLLAACDLMLQGNSERGLLTSAQHVTAKGRQEQGEKQIWRGMFLQLQIGSLLAGGGTARRSKR